MNRKTNRRRVGAILLLSFAVLLSPGWARAQAARTKLSPRKVPRDKEGVSRIDLTNEYVRAVQSYGLGYVDLKNIVRTGLQHAFLPGDSLWAEPDKFTKPVGACAKDQLGGTKPSAGGAVLLKTSRRAQQQWELERTFRAFESES